MSIVIVAGLLCHFTRNKCSNIWWGKNQIKAITAMIKIYFLFRSLPFVAWHDCSYQIQGYIFYNFEFVISVKDVKDHMLCLPFFCYQKVQHQVTLKLCSTSFVWKSSCLYKYNMTRRNHSSIFLSIIIFQWSCLATARKTWFLS